MKYFAISIVLARLREKFKIKKQNDTFAANSKSSIKFMLFLRKANPKMYENEK